MAAVLFPGDREFFVDGQAQIRGVLAGGRGGEELLHCFRLALGGLTRSADAEKAQKKFDLCLD